MKEQGIFMIFIYSLLYYVDCGTAVAAFKNSKK